MKSNTLLLVGGAGLAYYLYSSGSLNSILNPGAATQSTGTTIAPGTTASLIPAATAAPGYMSYAQMLAANPNVGNPNYVLTQADANQYMANYLDIRQWIASVVPAHFPNTLAACQYHWHLYGVPEQRTFLPLSVPSNTAWVPPPAAAKSSGGGFFSGILKAVTTVAPVIVALAGINDGQLNDTEVQIVACGSAIAQKILPFYLDADRDLTLAIDAKMKQVLKEYL